MSYSQSVYSKLVQIVGSDNVSADSADLAPYSKDSYTLLMKRQLPLPDCVAMPQTTDQVQQVVQVANEYKIPLYPRSFGVNIAGTALPYQGGIVLDLKRMNKIHEINSETMTATIEPGVNWGKLRKEAQKKGLDIIPIGGPYQTGPVGNFLLTNITPYSTKYSADRAVTLEAVLPNGEIIRTGSQATLMGAELNPYFRYAYGPDITGLFRGSLGNYGVITKLVLRLRPMAEVEQVFYFGFDTLADGLKAVRDIERLEITRYCSLANRQLMAQIALDPKEHGDEAVRQMIDGVFSPYVITVGLGGIPKQIQLYEEMTRETAESCNGRELELSEELKTTCDEFADGCSQKVLRMYAPLSGYAAIIGCVPMDRVHAVHECVNSLSAKYDLKDAITGEPLVPELIVLPYDRGSTVYVEQELLYDPLDTEAVEKVNACLRESYKEIVTKQGAVHTIPNQTLMKMMLPSYVGLLKGLKALVDPNEIFMPGGPYSLA